MKIGRFERRLHWLPEPMENIRVGSQGQRQLRTVTPKVPIILPQRQSFSALESHQQVLVIRALTPQICFFHGPSGKAQLLPAQFQDQSLWKETPIRWASANSYPRIHQLGPSVKIMLFIQEAGGGFTYMMWARGLENGFWVAPLLCEATGVSMTTGHLHIHVYCKSPHGDWETRPVEGSSVDEYTKRGRTKDVVQWYWLA